MRVLINAISAKAGGIATYTTNMIAALEKRGVDFLVAVPDSFPEMPHTIKIAASGYGPLRRLIWEQIAWRRMIKSYGADVLFSSVNFGLLNCSVPQLLLMREGGLFDPVYLATVAPRQGLGAAIQRYLRRLLMLLSARHNDLIITPTMAMRDNLLSWAPDIAARCSVNTYGMLIDTFDAPQRRQWRQDGVLRLLYVSVYYPHKNPTDGVLACEQLRAEGIDASLRLTMTLESIAGVRGGARDVFHVKRGIDNGFVKTGSVKYSDLPDEYANNDIFIFPSVSETFGRPMIEALASGIPVVAADVAVNREVLGDCALYYSPFRPGELVQCLKTLNDNPDLRADLATRGRERVTQCFNWDDHMDRLVELLGRLAEKGRRK